MLLYLSSIFLDVNANMSYGSQTIPTYNNSSSTVLLFFVISSWVIFVPMRPLLVLTSVGIITLLKYPFLVPITTSPSSAICVPRINSSFSFNLIPLVPCAFCLIRKFHRCYMIKSYHLWLQEVPSSHLHQLSCQH